MSHVAVVHLGVVVTTQLFVPHFRVEECLCLDPKSERSHPREAVPTLTPARTPAHTRDRAPAPAAHDPSPLTIQRNYA